MEVALVKTLANKLRTSAARIYHRYKGKRAVDGYTYGTLQVEVSTQQGKRCVYWGAIPLKVVKPGTEPLYDREYSEKIRATTSDLVQSLRADKYEWCGTHKNCQVHHVRKLAHLRIRSKGRKEKLSWVKRTIALRRKTLVVCHKAIGYLKDWLQAH